MYAKHYNADLQINKPFLKSKICKSNNLLNSNNQHQIDKREDDSN